jgi:hypothetical protein
MAPKPIARRAVKPVPTPKSMRPGASWFSVASALAATGAIAVRRHQHAGAEADALGVHGRRAHGDETIGAQHLCVVEPSMGEAELLGFLGDLPGICGGWQGDTEIHSSPPLSSLVLFAARTLAPPGITRGHGFDLAGNGPDRLFDPGGRLRTYCAVAHSPSRNGRM